MMMILLNCFHFTIVLLSSFANKCVPLFHLFKLPYPTDALCKVSLTFVYWKIFNVVYLIFLLLVIISRLRNSVALHLNKLESISPKNVFAKIDLNSACSSWEEDFFKVVNILVFTIFAIISFWKRFEQT